MFLVNILLPSQSTNNYISQIISIAGTIIGAIVGFLLTYFKDHIGKVEISVDIFEHKKSKKNEYIYNLKLFICNHSLKPNYMRSLKIKFYCNNNYVFESSPRVSSKIEYINILNKNKVGVVPLRYISPINIVLCDYINGNNYEKLSNVNKIMLCYKNEKGKIKTKEIKSDFSIMNVPIYNDGIRFFNFD